MNSEVNEIFLFLLSEKYERTETSGHRLWLVNSLPESEFKGLNKYLYFIVRYFNKLGLTPTEARLDAIIKNQLKVFISESQEKTNGTLSLNFKDPVDLERAYKIIREEIISAIEILDTTTDISKDWHTAIVEFFENSRREKIMDINRTAMEIATIGVGNKFGPLESLEYMNAATTQAINLYSESKLQELIIDAKNVRRKPELITPLGIPSIDNDTGGGIYSGELWSIEANSSVGKTRFAIGSAVYTALKLNRNVLFISLEQTFSEIESILIARYIADKRGILIPSTKILKELNLSGEEKELIDLARYALFESGKFGKFRYIDDITLNDFIAKLDSEDVLHGPFDLIVLDHMYILPYMYTKEIGVLDQATITGRGYKVFKKYVRTRNKAGIAINQLNQEGEEKTTKGISPGQKGAAGGKEVYRHTDYNVILYETTEMKRNKKMGIFITKNRSSEGNASPILTAYKAVAVFNEYQRRN